MKKTTLITGFVGLTVLAAIVVSGAYVVQADTAKTDGLVAASATVPSSEAGLIAAKFIKQVNILDSINIKADAKVLESDEFKSLIDFSRPIPDEPVGRDNPFAPF